MTNTTTLRQAVEALGFDLAAIAHPSTVTHDADLEVTMRPAVAEDGSVYTYCGGEALFAFQPTRTTRRALYLVRDSQEADVWEARMRREFDGEAIKAVHAMGPKPRVRLRLAQSA